MFNFRNDYQAIGHKKVLEALINAADEKNVGYGLDVHTANAKKMIIEKIGKDADIHFLVGELKLIWL